MNSTEIYELISKINPLTQSRIIASATAGAIAMSLGKEFTATPVVMEVINKADEPKAEVISGVSPLIMRKTIAIIKGDTPILETSAEETSDKTIESKVETSIHKCSTGQAEVYKEDYKKIKDDAFERLKKYHTEDYEPINFHVEDERKKAEEAAIHSSLSDLNKCRRNLIEKYAIILETYSKSNEELTVGDYVSYYNSIGKEVFGKVITYMLGVHHIPMFGIKIEAESKGMPDYGTPRDGLLYFPDPSKLIKVL